MRFILIIMLICSCSIAKYEPSFENIRGTVHTCNKVDVGSNLYFSYKICNDMELGRDNVQETSLWYKYNI